MRFFLRLLIAVLGGVVALAMLLVFLVFVIESAGSPVTDGWLGRWNGPEGTFLMIEGGNGRYEVTIQNLDGPRVFAGVAADEEIRFERDGVAELLHATDGAATGMKWLSEKSDCLTVRPGEGYCRD